MSHIASYAAVVVIGASAGAIGASVVAPGERRDPPPIVRRSAAPQEVRTVVETRTIRRVRHVHVAPRPAAPASTGATAVAAAPTASASAPPPAVAQPVVAQRAATPLQTRTSAAARPARPTAPLHTRTSAAGGSHGEHEAERGDG